MRDELREYPHNRCDQTEKGVRRAALTHTTTQMSPEDAVLSEKGHSQQIIYGFNLYETYRIHKLRGRLEVIRGWGRGEGVTA